MKNNNDPELFPGFNLRVLQKQAEKLANDNELIIGITLHYCSSANQDSRKYILVWEVLDPTHRVFNGLDSAIRKASNAFYGVGFADVYRNKADCPWRFSEEWDVKIIGPGDKFPESVLNDKFWLLYIASAEKDEKRKSDRIRLLIRKAGAEVKEFYDVIKDRLPISLHDAKAKDFLILAIQEIENMDYNYIKKQYFDESLFHFSKNREWHYFSERMLKKIVDGAGLGPITQTKCGELYKEIFKHKNDK